MPTKKQSGLDEAWVDPDDAPPLDKEFFDRAEWRQGDTLLRRGRPALADPKQLVTIRLRKSTLEALRARGRGWQGDVERAVEAMLAGSGNG